MATTARQAPQQLIDYAHLLARLKLATRPYRTAQTPDPDDWRAWLLTVFGRIFVAPLAPYHRELWRWVFALEPDMPARAFVGIWPRGFAKSTSVEVAAAAVAAMKTRRFVLYVCATQDQANDHVQNVAGLLEDATFEHYYPATARRELGKYGHAKAWRQSRLRTSDGFICHAIGLDSAARGVKIGELRPDLIICDDIDGLRDTTLIVRKKIETLTKTILPTGGPHTAVLIVQNLIHANSIVARIADGRADFLHGAEISGPHKAIDDLEIEEIDGRSTIVAGVPTWDRMDIATIQHELDTIGLSALLAELQQEVKRRGGSMFSHITYRRCTWEEVPDLERVETWIDPAVTNTDKSDAQAIQIDGLADKTIYRLWSWEERASPEDCMRRAILKSRELGATTIGVETDQGGDTWYSVYELTWNKLVEEGLIPADEPRILMADEKAGAGYGPKAARSQRMLTSYERYEIIHVRGTHELLEAALSRYLIEKPYDLVDAGFWSWLSLSTPPKGIDIW